MTTVGQHVNESHSFGDESGSYSFFIKSRSNSSVSVSSDDKQYGDTTSNAAEILLTQGQWLQHKLMWTYNKIDISVLASMCTRQDMFWMPVEKINYMRYQKTIIRVIMLFLIDQNALQQRQLNIKIFKNVRPETKCFQK